MARLLPVQGLLGLSKLSLGWMKLGIVHERIQPGRPQQNGRHERMHRTLKEDALNPPAVTLRAQQSRFDRFRYVSNRASSRGLEQPNACEPLSSKLHSPPTLVTGVMYPRGRNMTTAEQVATERRLTEIGNMFRACWNTYIIFYTVFLTFSITAIGLVGGWIVANAESLNWRKIVLIHTVAGLFIFQSVLAAITSGSLAIYSQKAGVAYDTLETVLLDSEPSGVLTLTKPVPVKLATYAGVANTLAMIVKACVWFYIGFRLI
jgi:hypothetical protein